MAIVAHAFMAIYSHGSCPSFDMQRGNRMSASMGMQTRKARAVQSQLCQITRLTTTSALMEIWSSYTYTVIQYIHSV